MSGFGKHWKIDGLIAGPITRHGSVNGSYSIIFERSSGAALEGIEAIDWSSPTVQRLPSCPEKEMGLPEGYGFELANIEYHHNTGRFNVTVRTARKAGTELSGLCDDVMTIDELRARKRELLARKRHELELQARGEGDNLALFMVREELGDVNDQLRALTAGRRQRGGQTAAADYTKDRQQYLDWRREDTALDGEIDEGRARLTAAAVHGLDLLTPRQRKLLELYLSGRNIPQIAGDLGVNKSTVSRSIALAKKKLREEAERAMTEARLRGEEAVVDLANPGALRAVMLAMTPKQTVYFYLYYSECLSLREIGELTGTIASAGCGPTCAAMAIATLKDKRVTPETTCAWSVSHGYKALKQGTYYSYFKPQLAAYGIDCRQLLGSRIINQPDHPIHEQVREFLRQGYWVIALMGPGTWTKSGHFVLLWDWDDKVRILDPASSADKRLNGDPATFRREARCYWLVDAREYNKEDDDLRIDKLTDEEVLQLGKRLQAVMGKQPVSPALAPGLQEAKAQGITDGSSPGAFCTRAQAAVMTLRAMKKA